MNIVFATNNQHKVSEINHIIGNKFSIVSLKDINILEDIPETQNTIEGNAVQKAYYVYNNYGYNCFADDTGLEVMALNNRPGIYSARYAGPECSSIKNMAKLLEEMKNQTNRSARFRTVIAYIEENNTYTFEGIIKGTISYKPTGNKGFGYDPIFIPDGFSLTFAEMNLEHKNAISHRGQALKKFVRFLTSRYN